jgi:hypothetical protein
LVLGLNTSSILKPALIADICEQDLSIVDDYSLYLTEGSGTAIYYENFLKVPQSIAANEWIRQKFLTTVVLDFRDDYWPGDYSTDDEPVESASLAYAAYAS